MEGSAIRAEAKRLGQLPAFIIKESRPMAKKKQAVRNKRVSYLHVAPL